MTRPVEIAACLLAGAVALGGGYVGAEALFGDDTPEAQATPERATPRGHTASTRGEGVELRNTRYGFSFHHPDSWRATSLDQPGVAAAVGRDDDVVRTVSIHEQELPSDSSGKPRQLDRMLAAVRPTDLPKTMPSAIGAKLSGFQKATLGGQEARSFMLEASMPPLGAVRVLGHATLRNFGAIVLLCAASERLHRTDEVKQAFRLVQSSFRFD